jgi:Ran GTPase-activating protein (RanGAP) involved in mRNA processing and transport
LYVDYRPLSASGCNALRKGILYHDNILTLSLQHAEIGDEGLIQLNTALDKVLDLKVLRLNKNSLSSASVTGLLKALCLQNSSLRELDLSENKIDGAALAELSRYFFLFLEIHSPPPLSQYPTVRTPKSPIQPHDNI